MRCPTRLAPLVRAVALCGACGPGAADRPAPGDTIPGAGRGAPVADRVVDSLRVGLDVPAEARVGVRVAIRLRIENATDRPVPLQHAGLTPTADVVVSREGAGGAVVWRSLEGQAIPAILATRTLAPRARVAVDVAWDQRDGGGRPVGPGSYRVEARLLTDDPAGLPAPARRLRLVPP